MNEEIRKNNVGGYDEPPGLCHLDLSRFQQIVKRGIFDMMRMPLYMLALAVCLVLFCIARDMGGIIFSLAILAVMIILEFKYGYLPLKRFSDKHHTVLRYLKKTPISNLMKPMEKTKPDIAEPEPPNYDELNINRGKASLIFFLNELNIQYGMSENIDKAIDFFQDNVVAVKKNEYFVSKLLAEAWGNVVARGDGMDGDIVKSIKVEYDRLEKERVRHKHDELRTSSVENKEINNQRKEWYKECQDINNKCQEIIEENYKEAVKSADNNIDMRDKL
jgi:hypothetical protein